MDEQSEAMATTDERKRRFGWTEDHDAAFMGRSLSQPARMPLGLGAAIGRDDNRNETTERRQLRPLALQNFALIEGGGIT